MSPCIRAVRSRIEESLTRLFKEVPNLRVSIGACGDYCDRGHTYVTTDLDLTTSLHDLVQFVRTVQSTGGGDLPECYELVLREALALDWSHNAVKVLVLIADDIPHSPTDRQNIAHNGEGIDWRKEADKLKSMGVAVYSIQCLSKPYATPFYRELAERTGGYHLTLDQFSEVTDLLMAICLKQGDPEQLSRFEQEVSESGRMTRSFDENLAKLSHRPISERFVRAPKSLDAVPPGRFQILSVDKSTSGGKIAIKDFVLANDLIFKTGRGFYQFTKPELIQDYKEVVLRDKTTGDMYTGETARSMIGLGVGVSAKVKPVYLAEFDVFVQSTSYNRGLVAGTQFLYEVDMSR
ncbi:MAG: hypothetical protein A2845_01900 [Candidatus Lloydbacteria bacterium RIFCSPHIGHO2_01_FULL_49_22]|uniref:VWFA domain-containing protein n=1 Tax=Candidatus Lloydbacteria bacterium RIFCSPHIGHO2_01_FULL_49_22 TaxID=1798658 RepID=A0A1G2CWI9_9BACT|nr:MAG: hypothetical protein A2845_01900 [Candidatus Lloydbacteria bacterium RIFCSPHIGHO2_01_FULL_49_22]OGZ09597.1 MAG: hypothetical protein A3C14_05875 [Candidatus Lloydbacteria bacterium RIFCSPHIGHO2_02_FULL_50_18]